jgi:hypothetical protein
MRSFAYFTVAEYSIADWHFQRLKKAATVKSATKTGVSLRLRLALMNL